VTHSAGGRRWRFDERNDNTVEQLIGGLSQQLSLAVANRLAKRHLWGVIETTVMEHNKQLF